MQEAYTMRVMEQLSIAYEIRTGRANDLADRIEKAFPTYLKTISEFNHKEAVASAMAAAAKYYERSRKQIPAEIEPLLRSAQKRVAGQCYDLVEVCRGGKGCIPVVTSLRPVDLRKPNDGGWEPHGKCGATNKAKPCGPPLGVAACW
jgi:hypothetical protein